MKFLLPLALLFLAIKPGITTAQVLSNDNSKDVSFLYESKDVLEFIERFNDDTSSHLRRQYRKKNKDYNIPHSLMLLSLFNRKKREAGYCAGDKNVREAIF